MLARLVFVFIIAAVTWAILRITLRKRKLTVKQFFNIYFATLVGLALVYLGVTGRLNPLFALAGAILPFVFRLLPWVSRSLQAFHLLRQFRGLSGQHTASSPQQSEITTRFLEMVLVHDTGMMDGKVLEGRYQGSQLSNLALPQLLELLDECRVDADSLHLLETWLDREHAGWREESTNRESVHNGDMSEAEALEVLGLSKGATRQEIIDAHRRLMQKLHPDHGGSTYLATRINAARDRLMEAGNGKP